MKYAVEQRLRFIEFLVFHYGFINRSMLMDYFGISSPQASRDIGDYMELAPNNLIYNKNIKTYQRSLTFKRLWE